tara:strand:+ start:454 stop:555 length:102 start_codon:yes stop_codon:yes gene_type:complete
VRGAAELLNVFSLAEYAAAKLKARARIRSRLTD